MTSARTPMRAPQLAGYTFERLLGSGGYSDVFLYEQHMPRRPVAIKVLLAEGMDDAGRQQFTDEANAMAAVSTHPYIVTIFHAEVMGGNPFLVMEFYPRPNFSVRARTEHLSVPEVLRTGIQVASAVETAHRAGILHRDIKPANILTSEYGRPGLTDFGIAATEEGHLTEATGMSIPWSPPEVVLGSGFGDERADVYSLGATVYTLLAGRSPHEVLGGSNRSLDLMQRIERADPPPTGRGDVPASLERLLRQTLSRSAADRPQSAAAFARALQDIEVEQGFGSTPLEVRDDQPRTRSREGMDAEDGTRLKAPVVIQSQAPGGQDVPGGPRPGAGVDPATMRRDAGSGLISRIGPPTTAPHLPSADPSDGGPRPSPPVFEPAPEGTSERRASAPGPSDGQTGGPTTPAITPVRVAAVILALCAALVVARLLTRPPGETRATTTSTSVDAPPPARPAAVTDLTVAAPGDDGTRAVAWTAPDAQQGDRYQIVGPPPEERVLGETAEPTFLLPAESPPCIVVTVVRDGRASRPVGNCS